MKDAQSWYGSTSTYKINKIYDTLSDHIDPKSDLDFEDPFELLVAVVLSAQATDKKSVNKACEKLYPVANTPETIRDLGVDGLIPYIKTIGLYNAKAKNIIQLCEQIISKHGATFRTTVRPRSLTWSRPQDCQCHPEHCLQTADHCGRYPRAPRRQPSQNCNNEKRQSHRSRYFWNGPPKNTCLNAHHYLILHGRYCCTARSPQCQTCPISNWCDSIDKTI